MTSQQRGSVVTRSQTAILFQLRLLKRRLLRRRNWNKMAVWLRETRGSVALPRIKGLRTVVAPGTRERWWLSCSCLLSLNTRTHCSFPLGRGQCHLPSLCGVPWHIQSVWSPSSPYDEGKGLPSACLGNVCWCIA